MGAAPSCKGAYEIFWDGTVSKLEARLHTSTTGWVGAATFKSPVLSANTTYYYQLSYDGSNARFYHGVPGAALTSDGKIAMTGTISQRIDEDLVLGEQRRILASAGADRGVPGQDGFDPAQQYRAMHQRLGRLYRAECEAAAATQTRSFSKTGATPTCRW